MTYRRINLSELLPADVIVTTDKNSPISATIRSLTGSSISRAMLYVGMLFLIFASSGCTTINKWRSRTPVPVSGPIEVGPEWVEITPPNPLISRSGTNQQVELFFEQNFIDDWGGADYKTLKLKDGKMTKLEIFLYDDAGNEYELFINGGGESSVRFTYNSPARKEYENFPNKEYIRLKVRSKTPIKVKRIEWNASYAIDEIL